MPHDVHGNLLVVGDLVVIPGRITQVAPDGEFCNCTVESEYVMPGNGVKSTFSALNTKQIERANDEQIPCSDLGRAGYESYCRATGGKSLISGAALPGWEALNDGIQGAWIAAAVAIQGRILNATTARQ